MAISLKADPIDREIVLALDEFAPAQRSHILAEFTEEQISEIEKANVRVFGQEPVHTVTVDGRKGAPLESVRPDGSIIIEFQLLNDVLEWIREQLINLSPVGAAHDPHSGLYEKSHALTADGAAVDADADIPPAKEYVFVNTAPYARKIEHGESSQAPDGVYQATATMAQRRFGNIVRISFEYRSIEGSETGGNRSDGRNPAIVVRQT